MQDVMGDAAAWVSVRVLGGSVPILQPQFLFPPPLSLDLAIGAETCVRRSTPELTFTWLVSVQLVFSNEFAARRALCSGVAKVKLRCA